MGYINQSQLDRIIDLPVALPMAKIQAADWLIVATVHLPTSMQLTYRWLCLQVVEASRNGVALNIDDQCLPVNLQLTNPNRGLAYIGILENYAINTSPNALSFVGTAVDLVIATSIGVTTRDHTLADLVITTPGDYSFVLVNNCKDIDLKVLVNGMIRGSFL